jgi:hypothetical protein
MQFQHTKNHTMSMLNMSWKKEMLNKFNRMKTDTGGHAAAFLWLQSGACATRADKESGAETDVEREEFVGL